MGWLVFLVFCGYKGRVLLIVVILLTININHSSLSYSTRLSLRTAKISEKRVQVHNAPKAANPQPTTNMYTKTLLIAALSVLAAASPINVAHPYPTGITPPLPIGSGTPPFPVGSGTPPHGSPPPFIAPFPTSVPVPRPAGDKSDCPIDGQLVCSGPKQWGLCNWGKVQFQPVAAGTQCLGGEIVFAMGFGTNA